MSDILLEVKGLKTHFFLDEGTVRAVDGVDFSVKRGQTLGIVGESGCGKSVSAFSILQLVGPPGEIVEGEILLHKDGTQSGLSSPHEIVDVAALPSGSEALRQIRGNEIAMIFQEPMTSLSMMHTVGFQIMEAILLHFDISKEEARERAIEMLHKVGIPKPEQRVDDYPFQLSGGMRQRAMIAMALSCNPSLLIADEPTTALDVTTQAQILELMQSLQEEFGMAVMMITHDLGVVAEICDEVVVMYLGEVVERADVDSLFHDPKHPYTQALLQSIPRLGQSKAGRLQPIEGSVPDPYNRPAGCPFHPRCTQAIPGTCDQVHPKLTDLGNSRAVRCVLYE
ncbi:MAG: ABC transporter ATP-binding protein [Chloroflexota bacterium]